MKIIQCVFVLFPQRSYF